MTVAADDVLRRALELTPDERVRVARELLASAGAAPPPADARLRALFERSPLAIGFSRDGVTLDASPAYARTFGFESGSELVGTPILQVIAPRARADIIDKVKRRARGEDVPDVYETIGVKKDGTEFPFQIHVTRVVLDDGPLTIATLQDISDRRRVEEATREAAEFKRHLIAASPSGILVYEAEGRGRCVLVNDAAAALVGGPAERLLEQHFRELDSWKRAGMLEIAETALSTGTLQRREVELRTTFGRDIVMAMALVPFVSAGKRHLLVLTNDVTERRRAQVALGRSEERLRLVLEATDQGIWDWNLATGERHLSPGFNALLGLAPGDQPLDFEGLLGRLEPEDAGAVRGALADHRSGDMRELEVRARLPDGATRWLLVRGRVLERDATGAARRIVGTISDATGRKRAEEDRRRFDERVRHAQKIESLGVLAGGIAHDFNNLLAAIMANTDLALLDLPPTSPIREPLDAVMAATCRAAELCRQMLAYAGKGRRSVAPVDLRELVPGMLQILQASISKKVTLAWRPSVDVPAVVVDASQLRQVVMNLVINAAEALGGASGSIDVTAGSVECDEATLARTALADERLPGTYAFLEVQDTGCGMDAQTQARMFEPFFSTKFMGRGLGMAAVLGIVRGHQGTIEVESAVGRGTRIRVLLPASEAAVEREPEGTLARPERWGSGTVVIADDEELVCKVLAAMVARMGFDPVLARNGQEAVGLVRGRERDVACVLLDVNMPIMDGLEALDEIRRLAPTMPVVVSSGFGEDHAAARLAAHDGVVFVAKPCTSSAVEDALRRVLGRARPASS